MALVIDCERKLEIFNFYKFCLVFFTVLLACASAFPLAGLIIGAIYLNQCTIENNIPIWLIGIMMGF